MYSIAYKFNGQNIKDLDIIISQSYGLTDLPKTKEPLIANWPDQHGIDVDLSNRAYEPRMIKLNCFMKCENEEDFITKSLKLNQLLTNNNSSGLLSLVVGFPFTKPLVYAVYLSGEISHTKKWRNGVFFSTFTLEFIEPDPMKISIIARPSATSVIFTEPIAQDILLNIYTINGGIMKVEKDVLIRRGDYYFPIFWNSWQDTEFSGYLIITCNEGINELHLAASDEYIILTNGI